MKKDRFPALYTAPWGCVQCSETSLASHSRVQCHIDQFKPEIKSKSPKTSPKT